jgi:hypothetical protein
MPEIIFESQEAVPEPFRPIAEAKDGKFVIDVAPAKDVREFRDRNIELSRARDDHEAFIARLRADLNFDPEKYDEFVGQFGELKTVKQQVDDGKLVADTSLDKAIEERTREMKREHENLVNSLKTTNHNLEAEIKQTKGKLAKAQVDREFMSAINNPKSGALPEASDTILMFAYDTWRPNEDGVLVGYDRENKIMYGADGSTPMTPIEWLAKLRENKPFLFKQSEGGGSGGGNGRGGLSPAELNKMSPVERMNYARSSTNA